MPGDLGPPVGFNSQGDMTPFTRFNSHGDWMPFYLNHQGDVIPFSFTNVAPDGTPSPFVFNERGDRIPNVHEIDGSMQRADERSAAQAHAVIQLAATQRHAESDSAGLTLHDVAFLLLL